MLELDKMKPGYEKVIQSFTFDVQSSASQRLHGGYVLYVKKLEQRKA